MSTTQLMAVVSLALLLVTLVRKFIRDRIERKGCPLPPGPTPLPFLGNALSISFHEPFKTYTEWRTKYGDILYTRVLGMDIVVLNTPSIASELFEKRWQIYSDRPFMATVEPYGHDSDFAFLNYGEYWRLCRRIINQAFRAEAVVSFHPIHLRKARQLVLNLMSDPGDYPFHISTFTSAVTMCSVYDYDPLPKGDYMVSLVNKFIDVSFPALMPENAVLINTFPFLLHLPEWIPLISFKRRAREARELGTKMVEEPYQYVLRRMESKEDINPSLVSNHISRIEKFEDDASRAQYEKAIKETASTAFLGGVETTGALLLTFTLAMVKNPRIWKRAQADIDAAIGIDRLPEFDDRSSLPYIDAILLEIIRWQPPVPLGAPHATSTSDIYNGYYIPKGATVLANLWAMTRDEARFPDAEKFIPERFLNAEGMLTDNLPEFSFGFGRRACPGRYAADSSLWICMATMLATLDFDLAQDAEGRYVEFEPKFTTGIARHPMTFPCSITPRAHTNKRDVERMLAK